MKKLQLCLTSAFLLTTSVATELNAASSPAPVTMVSVHSAETPAAKALLSRLDEIKALDKTKMSPSEKKQLRREVRSIKKELKETGGGVYLSVGAIIIIVLLLIILL